MYDVVGYHRPTTLPETLQLLAADDHVALAGGVHLHHDGAGRDVDVVDLQAAGLDGIELNDDALTCGAMVRLQSLVDDRRVPELVRDAARAEQPSALRTLATVGGAIAMAADDSLLLAAMLVHETVVRVAAHVVGERTVALADLLASERDPQELIVGVTMATDGTGALAQTGRTPRDRPIVGVVGRRVGDSTTLAACGVGPVPVLVEPGELATLESFDDHRATASYRRHLAEVLAARVSEGLA